MANIKFTRSECFNLRQYIHLGVTNPRVSQTLTMTEENNSAKPLSIDAVYDADPLGLAREIILINKDGYKEIDLADFASKFNARSTDKKIVRIITLNELAVERAALWD